MNFATEKCISVALLKHACSHFTTDFSVRAGSGWHSSPRGGAPGLRDLAGALWPDEVRGCGDDHRGDPEDPGEGAPSAGRVRTALGNAGAHCTGCSIESLKFMIFRYKNIFPHSRMLVEISQGSAEVEACSSETSL